MKMAQRNRWFTSLAIKHGDFLVRYSEYVLFLVMF